ncbi:50S ribosomal protein L23 [Piscirickettsia litoralis]|uniref:Large ribosomal subunit protein uL23 n=1 Tax=Piscirickettsia litoralis TaxID=1891921 RepID=A0ABX3A567_9GAMM|nr:50S ribosomal protein L23 [Piscirickettsia litoralis]ODN42816.1 50S ribosomal protein L23 [Piscirickettsia litoralis]
MNQERLLKVILAPHISEKAANAAESSQVVFKVATDATKLEIKRAVEKLFDVKVNGVTTVNVKGKTTQRGGKVSGRRKDWKKAYVTLQDGQELDLLSAK